MNLIIENEEGHVETHFLNRLVSTIGYGDGCDISLMPGDETKRLGILIKQENGYQFKPLLKEGGLRLNGYPISEMTPMKPNQKLELESFVLYLEKLPPVAQMQNHAIPKFKPTLHRNADTFSRSAASQAYSPQKKETFSDRNDSSPFRNPPEKTKTPVFDPKSQLIEKLFSKLPLDLAGQSEINIRKKVKHSLEPLLDDLEKNPNWPSSLKRELLQDSLLAEMIQGEPLKSYFNKGSIQTLICHSFDEMIVEGLGRREKISGLFSHPKHYSWILHRFLAIQGISLIDEGGLIHHKGKDLDVYFLEDQDLNQDPMLRLVKRESPEISLEELHQSKCLDREWIDVLSSAFKGGCSFILTGPSISCRGMLVNALALLADAEEKIFCLEKAEGTLKLKNALKLKLSGGPECLDLIKEIWNFQPKILCAVDWPLGGLSQLLYGLSGSQSQSICSLEAKSPLEALAKLQLSLTSKGVSKDLANLLIFEKIKVFVHGGFSEQGQYTIDSIYHCVLENGCIQLLPIQERVKTEAPAKKKISTSRPNPYPSRPLTEVKSQEAPPETSSFLATEA